MKKLLFVLVICLLTVFSMSSCFSTLYAYEEDYYPNRSEIELVLKLGTPHYFEGRILYYAYDGMFYYPYLVRNRYYYYRYRNPLPLPQPGRIFIPGRKETPIGHMTVPRKQRNIITDRNSVVNRNPNFSIQQKGKTIIVQPYQRQRNTTVIQNGRNNLREAPQTRNFPQRNVNAGRR